MTLPAPSVRVRHPRRVHVVNGSRHVEAETEGGGSIHGVLVPEDEAPTAPRRRRRRMTTPRPSKARIHPGEWAKAADGTRCRVAEITDETGTHRVLIPPPPRKTPLRVRRTRRGAA